MFEKTICCMPAICKARLANQLSLETEDATNILWHSEPSIHSPNISKHGWGPNLLSCIGLQETVLLWKVFFCIRKGDLGVTPWHIWKFGVTWSLKSRKDGGASRSESLVFTLSSSWSARFFEKKTEEDDGRNLTNWKTCSSVLQNLSLFSKHGKKTILISLRLWCIFNIPPPSPLPPKSPKAW